MLAIFFASSAAALVALYQAPTLVLCAVGLVAVLTMSASF